MENNLTMEILHDYKISNKRQFIINIILIFALVLSIGYIIYLLNDIQTVVETDTIDIKDINNINDSDIGIGR